MRFVLASAALALSLSVDAQVLRPEGERSYRNDDPSYRNERREERQTGREEWRRDRQERRERPRDQDRYAPGGYHMNSDPLIIVNRVMSDVRSVSTNNDKSLGKNERKHFEEVEEELEKFSRKYREKNYDKNNLKDAAESLEELGRSNKIRSSRDRRVLSDALNAVQMLRSNQYERNARWRY